MPVRTLQGTLIRHPIAVLVVALALAATGSPAAPVASAHAADWLAKQNYFHFPPFRPKGVECTGRRIKLKRGWYVHSGFLVSLSHRDKPDVHENSGVGITTGGWYRWRACRYCIGSYHVKAALRFDRPGTRWIHGVTNHLDKNHGFGDGWYEWGARLQWIWPM